MAKTVDGRRHVRTNRDPIRSVCRNCRRRARRQRRRDFGENEGGGRAGTFAAAEAGQRGESKEQSQDEQKEQTQKEKTLSAKQLFGGVQLPSIGKAVSIGYYPRGCLAGGVEFPVSGENWQVMRLSRNRNWGHPSLIHFLEKFAPLATKATGWNGILVGDLAQPRGGPSPSDHASHQTGLDVDIWFMPMPDRVLSKEERDTISAPSLVSDDWKHLNSKTWTPQHIAFIKTAAQQPEVERVLVNAVIKKELCRVEAKQPHDWLAKVRPWYKHHDHIHVRLKCPADSPNCRAQTAGTRRRWLQREGAQSLVIGQGAASVDRCAGQAREADDAFRSPARLQNRP